MDVAKKLTSCPRLLPVTTILFCRDMHLQAGRLEEKTSLLRYSIQKNGQSTTSAQYRHGNVITNEVSNRRGAGEVMEGQSRGRRRNRGCRQRRWPCQSRCYRVSKRNRQNGCHTRAAWNRCVEHCFGDWRRNSSDLSNKILGGDFAKTTRETIDILN